MDAITVTGLGKAYKQYPSRWARLTEWLDPRNKPSHKLHWVLKDLNFSVRSGEAVGIIGINGAGKSTLLKIITGTTQPTTGNVHISGRLAALLELGIGFHPEFTGRQNAYMAGQLFGYTADEITTLMPKIEAFAEIGDYFDQPVRIYSTGMQARVAFASAIHADPDILIVDEALAVGDARFQLKCAAKFEAIKNQGKTLILVSHSPTDIIRMTSRTVWLEHGVIRKIGPSREVMEEYIAHSAHNVQLIQRKEGKEQARCDNGIVLHPLPAGAMINGEGGAVIEGVGIYDENDREVKSIVSPRKLKVIFRVRSSVDIVRPWVGFSFINTKGLRILGSNSYGLGSHLAPLKAHDARRYSFEFVFPEIENGSYLLSVAVNDGTPADHVRIFNVLDAHDFEYVSQHPIQKQQAVLKLTDCELSETTP
jgi:lipopolysaccharide transport system ATP-binding protein